jgi:hypothetical protein
MANVSSRTLQLRLLILVFVAFIPALGLFWYVNGELRTLQLEAKEHELASRAQHIAAEYTGMLEQSRSYLATLAEFPEVRTGRAPDCTEYLQRAIRHMDAYTTISLIGMDGYLACGAVTPESDLYLGDRAYYTRASSRGSFAVGNFALGRLSGRPVLGLAHPIFNGDELSWILGASIDLGTLADLAAQYPLPEDYTFTVLSSGGQVMVRLPSTGDFTLADSVGAMAGPVFSRALRGIHRAMWRSVVPRPRSWKRWTHSWTWSYGSWRGEPFSCWLSRGASATSGWLVSQESEGSGREGS